MRIPGAIFGGFISAFLVTDSLADNRCETKIGDVWCNKVEFVGGTKGTLRRPVIGEGLDLVSFVGNVEGYEAGRTVNLRVAFFLAPTESSAVIRAREIEPLADYGMISDKVLGEAGHWHVFGPWNTELAAATPAVASDNLGVLVLIDGKDDVLAPAFVFSKTKPTAAKIYRLIVRPAATLTNRTVVVTAVDGNTRTEVSREFTDIDRKGGAPMTVNIPAASLPEGMIEVTIEGDRKNFVGPPSRRTFLFFHTGTANADAP
ncbi:hypothetical protein NKI31_12715 [Mesorhizobium sp. M0659]|uniref:hypothetical protein n=1 Tax=Mesorhizobium sp. M0659 TaxID=2956980 RepID=UPI00333AC097